MGSAAVVIPVYRKTLSRTEEISFCQCLKILSKYDIYIIAPQELDISRYLQYSTSLQVERFADKYFRSISGYNQLLLSPLLYKRFLSYEYLLIYQLDAYVFSDRLSEWCQKKYDYVGAPWIASVPLKAGKSLLFDLRPYLLNKVGNGGLSLRKTAVFYSISCLIRPFTLFIRKNEDFIWSFIGGKFPFYFCKPSHIEALEFAFELKPSDAYEMNHYKLPFGCHAWEKYEPEFWKKFIPEFVE